MKVKYALLTLTAALVTFGLWQLSRTAFYSDDFIWLYEAKYSSLLGIFRQGHFHFVRPMSNFVWLCAWKVFGLNPQGHHFVSYALHTLCAISVYFLTKKILSVDTNTNKSHILPGLIALSVFITRPTQMQSITWPSANGDILVLLFITVFLYCFISYKQTRANNNIGSLLWLGGSSVCLLSAIFSKESSIAIIPALVLCNFWLIHKSYNLQTQKENNHKSSNVFSFYFAELKKDWLSLSIYAIIGFCAYLWLFLSLKSDHGYSTFFHGKFVNLWIYYISRSVTCNFGEQLNFLLFSKAYNISMCILMLVGCWYFWNSNLLLSLSILFIPFAVVPYALFVPNQLPEGRYFYISTFPISLACSFLFCNCSWESFKSAFTFKQKYHIKHMAAYLALMAFILLGGVILFKDMQNVVECSGLPQIEQVTVEKIIKDNNKILKGNNKNSPVYIYTAQDYEPISRFCFALYSQRTKENVLTWDLIPYQKKLDPKAEMFFYNIQSRAFTNQTKAMEENHKMMVLEERITQSPLKTEEPKDYYSILSETTNGQGWEKVNITNIQGDIWQSPGNTGALISPQLNISPLAIQAVAVEVELFGKKQGEEKMILQWTNKGKNSNPKLNWDMRPWRHGPSLLDCTFFWPGSNEYWWNSGNICQLIVVPCVNPCKLRLGKIVIFGFPRKGQPIIVPNY